jgi:short-subunit dehydrogenase
MSVQVKNKELFTEGLNLELKATNVHITVIFPVAIATNIGENRE